MRDPLTVRDADEADLPAIRSLLSELTAAMEDPADFDPERAAENCRALLGRAGHHLLIASIDGVPCGLIPLTVRQSLLNAHPSGLIDELVVARRARGRGVGRRLIQAAVDRCRELGCSEVEVSTERGNRRARAFYRACGFSEEGVLFERHFGCAGPAPGRHEEGSG